LGQSSYKFCVQNSLAVQQWCQDNIQNFSQVILTTANIWTLNQQFNSYVNFLGGTSDSTAADGNLFYRTDLHRFRWYDNTAWRSIVGADSTDTLTNKTLANPVITGANFTTTSTGNTIQILNQQSTSGPLTGNSADQTVYTYTIPAATFRAGTI